MSTLQLVIPESATHWYDIEGKPMYSVPYKDPNRKGETRDVTLRDARELLLFPSATNVLGVLNKPGLEAWKQSQMVLAALTLPRLPGESLDDFALRVVEDGQAEAAAAREAGTDIHDALEQYLRGVTRFSPEVQPFIEGFHEWWWRQDLETEYVEHCFCLPEEGYGGRIDWVGNDGDRLVVIDWKTAATKPGVKPQFYPEWKMQEAAYARGVGRQSARLISVIVSRTEPGRIEYTEWTREKGERERWLYAFDYAKALWCQLKHYYPAQQAISSLACASA